MDLIIVISILQGHSSASVVIECLYFNAKQGYFFSVSHNKKYVQCLKIFIVRAYNKKFCGWRWTQ